jgi:hypothetical protein
MHSIGPEVESSYCLHRLFTNHEIRWTQENFFLKPSRKYKTVATSNVGINLITGMIIELKRRYITEPVIMTLLVL